MKMLSSKMQHKLAFSVKLKDNFTGPVVLSNSICSLEVVAEVQQYAYSCCKNTIKIKLLI